MSNTSQATSAGEELFWRLKKSYNIGDTITNPDAKKLLPGRSTGAVSGALQSLTSRGVIQPTEDKVFSTLARKPIYQFEVVSFDKKFNFRAGVTGRVYSRGRGARKTQTKPLNTETERKSKLPEPVIDISETATNAIIDNTIKLLEHIKSLQAHPDLSQVDEFQLWAEIKRRRRDQ